MLIPFATHAFLSAGSSSWVDALNTGIATYKPPTSKAANPVKVPKVGVNCGTVPTTLPAHKPGRKQHKAILADNPPEQEAAFYPAPGIDREAEKDRLSALFQHGRQGLQEMQEEQQRQAAAASRAKPQLDTKEQLIDQIIDEISERREFLQSMRANGRGQEYEATVKAEVSQRLAQLRRLGVDA
eukprot:jgi/Chrzof1/3403/Cz12g24020.t1